MLILTKFCFRFQNVQSTSQKYHPRRESFLHNQRASLPLKQKQIDSDSGLVDKHKIFMILLWKFNIVFHTFSEDDFDFEPIVTPFAQILAKLKDVRSSLGSVLL